MPKVVEYPRASMKAALELAEAVYDLGGSCASELAASKLKMSPSGGGFSAQISAAVKFGLVTSQQGRLSVTALFEKYQLAYNDDERTEALQEALLSPPVFEEVYNRFVGREVPVEHFDKLLIREANVPPNIASRVAKYFMAGAKRAKLLGPDNFLASVSGHDDDAGSEKNDDPGQMNPEPKSELHRPSKSRKREFEVPSNFVIGDDGSYAVRIFGPGMDSTIQLHEPEDLDIVHVMLKKVKRKMTESPAVEPRPDETEEDE